MKTPTFFQVPTSHEHENNLFKAETKLLQDAVLRLIKSAKIKGYLNSPYLDQYAGFSICLNADWGVGKTTFLNMFSNYLRSEMAEHNDYHIINYNAWENDGFADPFVSLYCEILRGKDEKLTEKLKKTGQAVWDGIKNSSPSILLETAPLLGESIHTGTSEIIKAVVAPLKERLTQKSGKNDIVKQYEQYHKNIENFKKNLAEFCSADIIKIIIVDELDRCNPLFAIKLLERIKHIFSAPNTIFLFAVNIKQLVESIKKLYGQDTDGLHYLSRFFNHTINFNQNYTSLSHHSLSINLTPGISIAFVDQIYSYFDFVSFPNKGTSQK